MNFRKTIVLFLLSLSFVLAANSEGTRPKSGVYKTFNEHLMRGVDNAADTPFVTVDDRSTEIDVSVHYYDTVQVRHYVRMDDYWFNRVELDLVKLGNITKSDPYLPRIVWRFIKKREIIEYEEAYFTSLDSPVKKTIYVKTPNGCVMIRVDWHEIDHDNLYACVIDIANNYKQLPNIKDSDKFYEKEGYLELCKSMDYSNKCVTFIGEIESSYVVYSYPLGALGEFGIPPGLISIDPLVKKPGFTPDIKKRTHPF